MHRGEVLPVDGVRLEHVARGDKAVLDHALGQQLVLRERELVAGGRGNCQRWWLQTRILGYSLPVMALPPPTPGQSVVITGASAGIGAELARQLADRGHDVVLVARREQRLRELAEQLRLRHGIHADVEVCDLGDADARRELVVRLLAGARWRASATTPAWGPSAR